MAGKTRPLGHCQVPGHGTRCCVAQEGMSQSKGRTRERQELRRELERELDDRGR